MGAGRRRRPRRRGRRLLQRPAARQSQRFPCLRHEGIRVAGAIPPPATFRTVAQTREEQLETRIKELESIVKAGAARESRLEDRLRRLHQGLGLLAARSLRRSCHLCAWAVAQDEQRGDHSIPDLFLTAVCSPRSRATCCDLSHSRPSRHQRGWVPLPLDFLMQAWFPTSSRVQPASSSLVLHAHGSCPSV
jgi:hypothetical protein